MRALEDRKSSSTAERSHESGKRRQRVSTPADPSSSESSSSESDSDSSDSDLDSSSDSERPRQKKRRTAKGIKVTPGYILRIGSSLREWGDWKREIERVFEGDPRTFRKGKQKIIKALDYVDKSLKTLWYTYRDQNKRDETTRWKIFVKWTRDNIQNGQNATATLYERYETAQKDENSSVLAFYSKLTDELKKQFKAADIKIPETRSECVAVAQRVWEGLHNEDKKMKESRHTSRRFYSKDFSSKNKEDYKNRHGHKGLYRRDSQKDWHYSSHRPDNHRNEDKEKQKTSNLCFKCGKSGHFAPNCPEKQNTKEVRHNKIHSIRTRDRSKSPEGHSRRYNPADDCSSDSTN
ncbi:hypothetical protein V1506DRAFT_550373 [Lipomyces tetrasporus]